LNNNKQFAICTALLLFVAGCGQTEDPSSIGLEYFPLAIDNEWVYQIDSMHFNPFAPDSTAFRFQRRHKVIGTRRDPAGRLIFEMEQSERKDSQAVWAYKHTFYIFKDRLIVEVNKENIKTIPLIFPVKQNKVWDGNQLNNKGPQPFVYKKVGTARRINGITYAESLMVQQIEDSTFFDQFRDREYYGKDVGLISKEHINFTTITKNRSGSRANWTLLQYKK
jgi:hypothetical protein